MVNQEIRDKIWNWVGPNSVVLADDKMITDLGEEAVPALIDILKHPFGDRAKAEYESANQFLLAIALVRFAKEGNREAERALRELAGGRIKVFGEFGQSAVEEAQEFLAMNTSSAKMEEKQADPKVLTQQGYGEYKEGKLDEAIRLYLEALSIDPNNALARSNLAHAYERQGKLKDAIREWEETLKRKAPSPITIPIPGRIDEAKRRLYEQENKNKDKNLPGAAQILNSYMKDLEKEHSNWRDIYPKIVRIGDTAVPSLIKALESRNQTLQLHAVALLMEIGGDNAMKALRKAYKSGNGKLQFHIKHYIADIDEQIKTDVEDSSGRKWWQFWKN